MITKEMKVKILTQKITNLEVQMYEGEIALDINKAVGDQPQVIVAQEQKYNKQKIALEMLEKKIGNLEV